MDPETLEAFQALENTWGPLQITSGFRCEKHNQAVGGAKSSQHLVGKAVDVVTQQAQQEAFILAAGVAGFRGFGRGEAFTHCDTRSATAQWSYPLHSEGK